MIKIFNNTEEIAEEIAQMLFALAKSTDKSSVNIALSGGNTPKAIFSYLESAYGKKLACSKFHFWWGDERCVPHTDADSNYKWAYELWLKPIGIDEGNIHKVIGENEPLYEAQRYADELRQFVRLENDFPVIDLNILGLGDDGHTASIFPDQMVLLSSNKWCDVATHPLSGQKRITLTGKILNNSDNVVFISTGSAKAKMVRYVAKESKPEYPASHIKPHKSEPIWLLDQQAAAEL